MKDRGFVGYSRPGDLIQINLKSRIDTRATVVGVLLGKRVFSAGRFEISIYTGAGIEFFHFIDDFDATVLQRIEDAVG